MANPVPESHEPIARCYYVAVSAKARASAVGFPLGSQHFAAQTTLSGDFFCTAIYTSRAPGHDLRAVRQRNYVVPHVF
jgi:hypothetical protein